MQRVYNVRVSSVPGSHIFPLEYPDETALAVKSMITSLEEERQGEVVGMEVGWSSSSSSSSGGGGGGTAAGNLIRPY